MTSGTAKTATTFPAEPETAAPPAPRPAERWTRSAAQVFIVGAPRSGTTWLQGMLGAHPGVATGPETHYFKMMRGVESAFQDKVYRPVGPRAYLTAEEFYAALADLFHTVASKVPPPDGPGRYFLEKTPEHCFAAPLIIRCLPGAKFIHLLRDGRHVVSSLIRAGKSWAKGFPADNATAAAQVWQRSVLASRRIPELLADPNDYRELRYEELRAAPREQLQGLFDWLGLPADAPEVVDAIVANNELDVVKRRGKFDAIVSPQKGGGVPPRQPEGFFGHGASDGRDFGLTRLQEYQCYRICGPLLEELGYCPGRPRVPWWASAACSWKLRRLLRLPPV